MNELDWCISENALVLAGKQKNVFKLENRKMFSVTYLASPQPTYSLDLLMLNVTDSNSSQSSQNSLATPPMVIAPPRTPQRNTTTAEQKFEFIPT